MSTVVGAVEGELAQRLELASIRFVQLALVGTFFRNVHRELSSGSCENHVRSPLAYLNPALGTTGRTPRPALPRPSLASRWPEVEAASYGR